MEQKQPIDLLSAGLERVVARSKSELAADSNAYVVREKLTEYPATLFSAANGGLRRDEQLRFPNDRHRFERAFLADVQLRTFYNSAALPSLVGTFPLLRERDSLTDLHIDVTLAPLLSVSVADALRIYPRARNVIDRQRTALDELNVRSKLLISNLSSLFDWSFEFRRTGLTLVDLVRDIDDRRYSLDSEMYSIRSRVINDELRNLIDRVRTAEANFNAAQKRHAELFKREVAERKRAIDLLTNYLSGTLFRVGGNLSQISPRYDVSVRGTPFEAKIAHLIPLYRRLRALLIQHKLLRPLVDQIIQHVRASPDLNKKNPLLKKYF